jgi:hypothetical protein
MDSKHFFSLTFRDSGMQMSTVKQNACLIVIDGWGVAPKDASCLYDSDLLRCDNDGVDDYIVQWVHEQIYIFRLRGEDSDWPHILNNIEIDSASTINKYRFTDMRSDISNFALMHTQWRAMRF